MLYIIAELYIFVSNFNDFYICYINFVAIMAEHFLDSWAFLGVHIYWLPREGFKKKAQTWDIVPNSATPSPPELGTSLSEITNTTK